MLKLFNTLSREKEEFKPLKDNLVSMYSCGPTVYNYAHIGNMRSYIFMDLLRRVLMLNGYKIKGVLNITDVGHLLSDADEGEDKMEVAAREQNTTPQQIADRNSLAFFKDIASLNIKKPEIIAKATDHINDMIDYVVALEQKGHAYETSDGIYFDISTFKDYGKLSRIKFDEQIAGARVAINNEKRHPADFALWKKAEKNHIMQWDSPWGMGYPGWHIECSAMCKKYLGVTLDIHTGGVDHIPIHHENEIAQSEAREGVKTVNYWMHGEFIQVDNGKMSKSLGNAYTLDDLKERGFAPLEYRYFCLNAHYRKKLNFTFEGMDAAKTSLERLYTLAYKAKTSNKKSDDSIIEKCKTEFLEAVNDDLNIPLALGVLWTMLKEEETQNAYTLALEFDKVLGLSLDKAQPKKEDNQSIDIPKKIIELADARLNARKSKDFKKSDLLRTEIENLGYQVIDNKEGYTVKRKE